MVKKYKIVSAEYESEVEKQVNVLLTKGWTPQGGISFIPETKRSKVWYAQALVFVDGA